MSMNIQKADHGPHMEEARNEYGIIVRMITRRKFPKEVTRKGQKIVQMKPIHDTQFMKM
jgi:hypothetical protein